MSTPSIRSTLFVLLLVGAFLGLFLMVQAPSAPSTSPLPLGTSVPGDPRPSGGVRCAPSTLPCIQSLYGRDVQIFTGAQPVASARSFRVDGATGTTQHGGFQILDPGTSITVTNGITNLTPLATFQPLTSSGTVTVTSLITSSTFITGTIVRLYNTSNTSVVLTNGTYLVLPSASNLTLGQNDAVMLWFDGTKWIAFGSVNN